MEKQNSKRALSSMRKAQGSVGKKPGAKKANSGRKRIPYTKEEIHEIFHRFSLQRPEPKSELDYTNAFTMLVAVVLSAQATDAGVNKATKALFARADTPAKMAALGEAEIGRYIRTIGLWRAKAKNVAALSEALVRDFGGDVPDDREALMKLPGVGRKTANVVLNNAFGEPTLAVDTHIFRLGNRLLLAPGKTPDEVEAGFLRIIPPDYLRHAHHWLILHGRYVCKARRPECERCIIADLCKAPVKTCDIPAPIMPIEGDLAAAQ
jgi:endonuclease-3